MISPLTSSTSGPGREEGARAVSPLGVLAIVLVLFISALMPFASTLRFDLVWDDHYLLRDLRAADELGGLPAVLSSEFLPTDGVAQPYYRPVVQLSLWAGEQLGSGARMHHLVNLLLHLGNTLLTAGVIWLLTRNPAAGLIGGTLFAVHPIHVEPVSFVAGQTGLWAMFFVLLSTLAWLRARLQSEAPSRRRVWWAAALAAFGAGGFSKESALVLPIVLVVWACLGLPVDSPRGRPVWRRGLPTAIAYGTVLLLVLVARRLVLAGGGNATLEEMLAGALLREDPALATRAMLWLARGLVFPWPQNTLYTREHLVLDAVTFAAITTLLALTVWAARAGLAREAAGGVAWILAFLVPPALIPASSEIPTASRFAYLSSFGFCLVVGALLGSWLVREPVKRARPLLVAALSVAVFMLGASSFRATATWRNDLTLALHQVRLSPHSALAHQRLGGAWLEAREYARALEAMRAAVRLDPADPAAHNGVGIALRRLGRPAEAAEAFREAIRLDPTSSPARLNLAYVCLSLRDARCVEDQRHALEVLDPHALAQLDAELARWLR